MSRNYSLKYRAVNPRSVRGAKKRGWQLLKPNRGMWEEEKVSWAGLNIWADRHCKGHYVSSYLLQTFAFENPSDALLFQLKWA
jgi:hypothetical protein